MPSHKDSLHRDIFSRSHSSRSPDCPEDDATLVSVIGASGQTEGETSWPGTAFVAPFREPARNCSLNEGSTRVASRTSLRRRVLNLVELNTDPRLIHLTP